MSMTLLQYQIVCMQELKNKLHKSASIRLELEEEQIYSDKYEPNTIGNFDNKYTTY